MCHSPSIGMSWLEFMGLTSILAKRCLANLLQLHHKGLNLRRKRRRCLSLSTSVTRRSALNLLRPRIFVLNWTGQLLKSRRFGNCLTLLHCKLHLLMPYKLPSLGLGVSSLVKSMIQLLQLPRMDQWTQTKLAITARIWAIV